jgi:hypothetical protein
MYQKQMNDVIHLGPAIEEIKLDALPSANFGPGAELLMNTKKTHSSGGVHEIALTDLDSLEKELNDLSNPKKEEPKNIFSLPAPSAVRFEEKPSEVKIDSKPIEIPETTKSWDGFKSFTTVDPEKEPSKPAMNKEDLLRTKFKYLRKLEELEQKGVALTKKYSMDSNLEEMQGEYETLVQEKERKNSVKFQGKMLMAFITGIEFLNNKFDPFDVKIDGWAEQVNENIDDYDEIFAELHEKYKSKATLAPELKLLFQLGGGAIMLHMTNTMFKSAIPGMDDIMRQNPDLMQKFTQAAVSSVAPQNPGFSGFMNSVTRDKPFASPRPEQPSRRPEMKGPSDISDILSGLKSKTVAMDDEGSTVSASELLEMNDGLKMPRKSKKRSDKNTLHL